MPLFTLKGPAVIDAITNLGCVVHLVEFSYLTEYTAIIDGRIIATFDLCPDGAFRFGQVLGADCASWHEFHIELQESVK